MIYRGGDAKVLAGRVDCDADRVSSRPLPGGPSSAGGGVPVREELGDSVQVRRRGVRGEGEVILVDGGGGHEALLDVALVVVVVVFLKLLPVCSKNAISSIMLNFAMN